MMKSILNRSTLILLTFLFLSHPCQAWTLSLDSDHLGEEWSSHMVAGAMAGAMLAGPAGAAVGGLLAASSAVIDHYVSPMYEHMVGELNGHSADTPIDSPDTMVDHFMNDVHAVMDSASHAFDGSASQGIGASEIDNTGRNDAPESHTDDGGSSLGFDGSGGAGDM